MRPRQKNAAERTGIHGSSVTLKVRRALLFYALKRLGLDVAPEARPPSQQHVVLVNRREVEAVRTGRGET
jgi:hypothetical protein